MEFLDVCIFLVDPTGITTASSTLSPGTAGAPCPTNPCLNAAACYLVTGGGFVCNCIAGFSGLLCDIPGSNSVTLLSQLIFSSLFTI